MAIERASYQSLRITVGGRIIALPYLGVSTERQNKTGGSYEVDLIKKGAVDKYSVLGTPIHQPVTLGGFDLPNEPLMDLTCRKVIVKTPIAGSPNRRGTVKEDMGLEDYVINLSGWLINEDADEYPALLVGQLRELVERREAVSIASEITTIFGINQVVIEDWSFPRLEGYLHAQPYALKLISDDPFELTLQTE